MWRPATNVILSSLRKGKFRNNNICTTLRRPMDIWQKFLALRFCFFRSIRIRMSSYLRHTKQTNSKLLVWVWSWNVAEFGPKALQLISLLLLQNKCEMTLLHCPWFLTACAGTGFFFLAFLPPVSFWRNLQHTPVIKVTQQKLCWETMQLS